VVEGWGTFKFLCLVVTFGKNLRPPTKVYFWANETINSDGSYRCKC
jgi:hypothetical protein